MGDEYIEQFSEKEEKSMYISMYMYIYVYMYVSLFLFFQNKEIKIN